MYIDARRAVLCVGVRDSVIQRVSSQHSGPVCLALTKDVCSELCDTVFGPTSERSHNDKLHVESVKFSC